MPGALIGLCLCYGLGILTGTISDFPLTFLFSILVITFVAGVFSLVRDRPILNSIFLYLCLFLLGAIVIQYHRENPFHIANLLSGDSGRKLDLKGTVVSERERGSFTLRAEEVFEKGKWSTARGLVLVRTNFGRINCRYGNDVRIRGYLYLPPPPRNPGQFDYRSFLARKKIHVLANVSSPDSVTVLGVGRINPLMRLALTLKHNMERVIRKTMKAPQRFFLESVLLGNRYLLPRDWKETFTHTGTAHLISISGLHVGFVLAIFLLIFRILNLPSKVASVLTIVGIVLYCLLTGCRAPVVRASIMAIMILAGMLLDRPTHIWNSLFAAAFIILILNPFELFAAGFQMSFMAVAGIIYVYPCLEKLLSPKPGWLRWVWKSTTVIVAAQLAVLPLGTYYFNIFPLVTFPANFIVVPLLGLIVGLGFLACISGFIWIGLAHLFNATNWVLVTVLFKILNFFDSIPGSYIQVPSPRIYVIVTYYLVLFVLLRELRELQERNAKPEV